jgi:hypothetical protein
MLSEDERNCVIDFLSEYANVEIKDAQEISDDWFLRLLVASYFPSAPEPVDPLRFLRATAPQLSWPGKISRADDLDDLLVCLVGVGVRAEAKDVVIGKMYGKSKATQEILRRLIRDCEASDENAAPEVKDDDKFRREIGNLKRQLEIAEMENARLRTEFRKRETLLLQVVHNLGMKIGQSSLSLLLENNLRY